MSAISFGKSSSVILLKIISLSSRNLLNPQLEEFYTTVSVHFIGMVVKKNNFLWLNDPIFLPYFQDLIFSVFYMIHSVAETFQ